MIRRNIESKLRAALADTPVVLLNGARQTGKSTLARSVATPRGAGYVTLDDATALAAAGKDPHGFIAGLPQWVVIDEVQKAPGLFPAIKMTVDEDRRPGRFLLTGSANLMLLPRVSESLAGRMEILTLEPLAQDELAGVRGSFIDRAFADVPSGFAGTAAPSGPADLVAAVLAGGYPEAQARAPGKRREAWFAAYLSALLQRDVRDLANIEGLTEMPRLLALLAARLGGLLNSAELSRGTGIPQSTLKRYLALLEAAFLYRPLPAWSANLGKRLIKAPKIHLIDSGLAAHLIGYRGLPGPRESTAFGHLLEGFVVGELRKQAGWAQTRVGLWHYRTTTGREVDCVLEDPAGRLVGIEVKAAATLGAKDFTGLESLAADAPERFHAGFLLYTGERALAFGERLWAIPVWDLWRGEW
jgi:predicted AAA+ superfamily ATPase